MEIGEIKSAEVVMAPNGKSRGFAFVVYKRKIDAQKAIDTYNGVPLDGKPLKINVVQSGPATSAAAVRISAPAAGGRGGRTVTVGAQPMARPRAPSRGSARGGRGAGGRGRGRGRGKAPEEKPSMEDLDKDLEMYRAGGGD
uniref:RRM domain-containing protein n=2 Tax=Chrysotila carterae TaxID=13221 RepID=A0A7S4B9A4_CHRCT